MKIVEAQANDFDRANLLFKELDDFHANIDPARVRLHEGNARSREEFDRRIYGKSNALFLCFIDCNVVALANVNHRVIEQNRFRVGREFVLLENLFVLRAYRRRGIGKALFEHACTWAGHRGVSNIELNLYANNREAREFYFQLGFKPCMLRMDKAVSEHIIHH